MLFEVGFILNVKLEDMLRLNLVDKVVFSVEDGRKKVGRFNAGRLKSKMSNLSHFLKYPLSNNIFVSPTVIGVILLHYTQTCRNPLICGYVINVHCRTPTVQCD